MNKKVVLCYGKTSATPGRYLEDGFRELGVPIEVLTEEIDGSQINANDYLGVIFIESPKAPTARNMDLCSIPRLYWIHHGKHHLQRNLELIEQYRPNLILMAHSLHLAKHFPVKVIFFPFAVASNLFNSFYPFKKRDYDVAFVGRSRRRFYKERNRNLRRIRHFIQERKLAYKFTQGISPEEIAKIYGRAKIVFNQSSDRVPETMNMRIFEAIGSGALLFTNEVPLQDQLFKKDIHYITFTSTKDMMQKLKYYLSQPQLSKKIARQGYKHAMKNHTYVHRAKAALQLLEELSEEEETTQFSLF